MESPVRKMQKKNDYNRHKLFRKIARRRRNAAKQMSTIAEKQLRKQMRIPSFDDGKDQYGPYGINPEYVALNPGYDYLKDKDGYYNIHVGERGGTYKLHKIDPVNKTGTTYVNGEEYTVALPDNFFSTGNPVEDALMKGPQRHDKPLEAVYPEAIIAGAGRAIANGAVRTAYNLVKPAMENQTVQNLFAADAAYRQGFTDDGWRKTARLIEEGNYGEAALSGASDIFDLTMMAPALYKGAKGAYDLSKQGLNWANRNYVLPYKLYREIDKTTPVLELLNPATRIKLGDVEINNPLLAYRLGNAGNVTTEPEVPTVDFNTARTAEISKPENVEAPVRTARISKPKNIGEYTIDDFVDADGNINNRTVVQALRQLKKEYNIDIPSVNHVHYRHKNAEPYLTSLRHMWNAAKTAQSAPVAEGSTKQRQVFEALVHDIGELVDRRNHASVGADIVSKFLKEVPVEVREAISQHMEKGMPNMSPETQALHFADVGSGTPYLEQAKRATYANYRKLNPISNISGTGETEPVRDVLKDKINPVLERYGYDVIPLDSTEELARSILMDRIRQHHTIVRGVRDPRNPSTELIDQVKKDLNLNREPTTDEVQQWLVTHVTTSPTGHGTQGWGSFSDALLTSDKHHGVIYSSNSDTVGNYYASRAGSPVLDEGGIWHAELPIIEDPNMSLTDLWLANDFPLYKDVRDARLSSFYNYELPYRLKTGRSLLSDIEKSYASEIDAEIKQRIDKIYNSSRIEDDRFLTEPKEYTDPDTGRTFVDAVFNDNSEYLKYLDKIDKVNRYVKENFPNSNFEIKPSSSGTINNPKLINRMDQLVTVSKDYENRVNDIFNNYHRGTLPQPAAISDIQYQLFNPTISLKDRMIIQKMIDSEADKIRHKTAIDGYDLIERALRGDRPPFTDEPPVDVLKFVQNASEEEIIEKIMEREAAFRPMPAVKPVNRPLKLSDSFSRAEKNKFKKVAKALKENQDNLNEISKNRYEPVVYSEDFMDKLESAMMKSIKSLAYNIKERWFEGLEAIKSHNKEQSKKVRLEVIKQIIKDKSEELLKKEGVYPMYQTDDIMAHPKIFTTEGLRKNVSKGMRTRTNNIIAKNKYYKNSINNLNSIGYQHYIIVGNRNQEMLVNPVKISDKNTKAIRAGARYHHGPVTPGLSKKVQALLPYIVSGGIGAGLYNRK